MIEEKKIRSSILVTQVIGTKWKKNISCSNKNKVNVSTLNCMTIRWRLSLNKRKTEFTNSIFRHDGSVLDKENSMFHWFRSR